MIIYTACDQMYFDEFVPPLINSIQRNTTCECYIHVFDPRPDQLELLESLGVAYSYEHTDPDRFVTAAQLLTDRARDPEFQTQLKRSQNAMLKGNDVDLADRMRKTYYACARFVALANLLDTPTTVFAIDVDAIVRLPIEQLSTESDFYLHQVLGKKSRYLAGGMYLNANENSVNFVQEYAQAIIEKFDQNYLYWGLDQDILDDIIPSYQCGQLPMGLIDWNMQPDSAVWTAKGTRKELDIFVNEKKKYSA